MATSKWLHWFWAKLGHETWPERYHPVICHLIDVGQVAHALWKHALRNKMREWVTEQLGLKCPDETGRWIAFWVGAHDIGKVTPCFQSQGKTEELSKLLAGGGFKGGSGNPHHTLTGTKILARELVTGGAEWHELGVRLARKIAVCVGGHHGTFPTSVEYDETDSLGNDQWAHTRKAMLGELARSFNLGEFGECSLPSISGVDQAVWMFLAGLTSVADWIGSNVDFFSPFGNAEGVKQPFDVDGYSTRAKQQAANALTRLGWLGRSQAGDLASFEKATGINSPRPLQTQIIEIARELANGGKPGIVIVEAPMGEGKTEAAWYVADCWDRKDGAGTYVALPTMATSNQMFDRVGNFLEAGEAKKNVMLMHGKAALNEQFDMLKFAARLYDDEKSPSAVVAEEWFAANKKHGLLAPYGVGTIDQALIAVLQTKHFFVRLFGLAGKCVILDEVHAYDAYMTTLMERLLRWLAALRCPVVLLSATLPKERRLALMKAYAGEGIEEPEEKAYPRVTTWAVGHKKVSVEHCHADEKRAKTLQLGWVTEVKLLENLKTALKDGGCAAVIRNTVGLAQETYISLRDGLEEEGIEVELFHARFPFGKRDEIEKKVLNRFGKGMDGRVENPCRPKKAILVATQVIEQSLDLDFDVMFSDIAPVDLVLQRAGRLHRHPREVRPQGVQEPYLWLIEPGEEDGRPDFGSSEYVYSRFVLLRSLIALRRPRETICLPKELEPLVEQVYGNEPLDIAEDDKDDLEESELLLKEELRKQRRAATSVMIYDADAEDLLEQPNMQLQEDDPDAHKKIQAVTRDTEPTIQLILVYQIDGRDYLDPEGCEQFDESEIPPIDRLRRLLRNEVTISNRGCVFHYLTQPVPTGWKKNGMLRHHRILRVNASGNSLLGEFEMKYDLELGVVI